jgi:hypothetical protein
MVQKQRLHALRNSSVLSEPLQKPSFGQQNSAVSRTRASNGTLATATFLGNFPGSKKTVKDSVGRGNPTDFFRVDLSETSRIKVNFFNRSNANLRLTLLDTNGNVVSANGRRLTTIRAGKTATTLVRGAVPGTYYLKAEGAANGNHRYEMNLFINRSGGPAPLPCGCGV